MAETDPRKPCRRSRHPVLFVTGGSGVIGHNLLRHLVGAGFDVVALQRRAGLDATACRVVHGDVRDFSPSWLDGIDTVVHLAAVTVPVGGERHMRSVNVDGTRALVNAVKACGRPVHVICTSSVAAFGPSGPANAFCSDGVPHPITHYGRTKLEAEQALASLDAASVVRLPMVTGGGDRVAARLERMAAARVFPVSPARFSAIDVRDVCALVAHLADRGPARALHTVSDGAVYDWRFLADAIERRLGRRLLKPPIPRVLLQPLLFRLLGNADAAYYLGHDWVVRPDFPDSFHPLHGAFPS